MFTYAAITVTDTASAAMKPDTDEVVFSTSSSADFGFETIFLTNGGANHISIGHRDIGALPHTLIKKAVEQPTQVYLTHISGRFLFVSTAVNKSDHPMAVIVERVQQSGKIITATWKESRISGNILWESNNNLYTHLDRDGDVLYVSRGPAVASYAVEDEQRPDIWYRWNRRRVTYWSYNFPGYWSCWPAAQRTNSS